MAYLVPLQRVAETDEHGIMAALGEAEQLAHTPHYHLAIMLRLDSFVRTAAVATLLLLPAAAQAQSYTYVGSWYVSQGPSWTTNPQVMSGRGTAAFLFGGTFADYAISTLGTDATMIDFKTYLDGWGDDTYLNTPADQDFSATTNADGGYNCGAVGCSFSAYVSDHGASQVNYAFRIDATSTVPEPAAVALLATGIVALGGVAHLRRRTPTA
jgi:hypothetical protein